jgi:hypothetical protein
VATGILLLVADHRAGSSNEKVKRSSGTFRLGHLRGDLRQVRDDVQDLARRELRPKYGQVQPKEISIVASETRPAEGAGCPPVVRLQLGRRLTIRSPVAQVQQYAGAEHRDDRHHQRQVELDSRRVLGERTSVAPGPPGGAEQSSIATAAIAMVTKKKITNRYSRESAATGEVPAR